MEALPWKDFITFGAALLGAALGIMNTWNAISQRRLRLRVRPAHAISMPHGTKAFSIEVINLSAFPVTITEVGFALKKGIKKSRRFAVVQPIVIDGGPWPRRLEPRAAVTAYCDPSTLSGAEPIGKAYAQTSCDEVAYGDSPALEQLRQQVRGRRT
jgi:hypothetical protein